jgi:hypothetical protein
VGECGDDSERGVLWEGPRDPLGYDALGVEVEPESEELEELLAEPLVELESELFDESEPVEVKGALGAVDGVEEPEDPRASFL